MNIKKLGCTVMSILAVACLSNASATTIASFDSSVTTLSNGLYLYQFTLTNLGTVPINGVEMFYFDDPSISNVTAPIGWVGDNGYTPGAYPCATELGGGFCQLPIVDWFVSDPGTYPELAAGDSLSGFSFTSNYGPTKYPFTAYSDDDVFQGDPSGPASPAALAELPLLAPLFSTVPEPDTAVLFSLGIAALMTPLWRRKSNHRGRRPGQRDWEGAFAPTNLVAGPDQTR